jgi:formylglycine-generating enzyme required for sulfatase activity
MEPGKESQPIAPAAFSPRPEQEKKGGFKARPLQIGIASLLLFFAVTMWFLFTARSVLFTFDPAYSELDIDGGLQLKIGERYLLREGEYDLAVTAPGHYPQEQAFTVSADESQELHLVLKRLPGKLSFETNPAGAQVLVDGDLLGTTPLSGQPVAAGERELRLLAERYLPYHETVEVTGMEVAQAFAVELEPAWANIALSSVPIGATIFVDGEERGQTPAMLEILQGEHMIELRLARFQSWEQVLAVSPGIHQNLEPVTLLPADGLLELTSRPSGANVTVDGEFRGQTPISLTLDPDGEHRVAVLKPGYERAVRSVALDAEEILELNLSLKPRLGEVQVLVTPPQAEVFVAGRSRGRGNQSLSLPSYEQVLEVKLAGHQSYRQRFTPRPGFQQVIPVKLMTESEARLADLKSEIRSPAGQTLKLFTPSGSFTMGASRREPGRRSNEVLHPVEVTRLFYLGTHEVTNAQFRKWRTDHSSGQVEGNSLNRDEQPVVSVSWEEAALYSNWLSEREGLPPFYKVLNGRVIGFEPDSHGYRLPTEAEWAWAARVKGEELLKYPWGENFPPPRVVENYADTSSSYITGRYVNNYNDGSPASAKVGSFEPNHRGLYDMGGNVAEWVHDIYTLTGAEDAAEGVIEKDPLGTQTGSNNVIRGASWAHGTVTELRLSFRDYGQRGRDDVGFRVARYAEEKP